MPEGRIEAQCEPGGRWNPDPTSHLCGTTTELLATSQEGRMVSYSYKNHAWHSPIHRIRYVAGV